MKANYAKFKRQRNVYMLKSPGSTALEIGSLNIYWYGIIIALAFVCGFIITVSIAAKTYPDKETKDHIIDLSTILLITGIVSARLYYVLFNLNYYKENPLEVFMLWQGGLSIHGVIIGCLLVMYLYTKIHKLSMLKYTDLFAFGLIFAQAIGRWGNFFNSEAFGTPTDLPWKLYIPPENRPPEYINFEYFHPAFLYESLWNLLLFFIFTVFLQKYIRQKPGIITFSYFVLYSLGRFFIEGIRLDNIYSVMGLHLAQFICIVMLVIGIVGLYIIISKNNNNKITSQTR